MCIRDRANISQYLLGGGDRGYNTNQELQSSRTRKNVVGFLDWLLDGHSNFTSIRPVSYTHLGYEVIVEQQIAHELQLKNVKTGTLAEIGQLADLAVVVGGDGNMLGAARTLARYDIKVIGINRGNLGFLTDLDPDNAQQQLADVLEGHYISEKRFLLEAQVCQQDCQKRISTAINEVVLHPGKVAHMIEFEVYIDEIFAFSQRSDGLIISTPTGSTAYSLSAGGPILTPSLDAITLVPMFPHTLSARPLVINSSSTIRLRFSHRRNDLEISCDSPVSYTHLDVYKRQLISRGLTPSHHVYVAVVRVPF